MPCPRWSFVVALLLAVVVTTAPGAQGDATKIRTLATVKGMVLAFDQDGNRVATVERPRKSCDRTSLVVRNARGGRVARLPVGLCDPLPIFAFGGDRATWRTAYYGNNQYQNLVTVTTKSPRPVALGELVLDADGQGEEYSDVDADGPVSIFGVLGWGTMPQGDCSDCREAVVGGAVKRIGATPPTPVPGGPPPGAIAVNGSRIAIASAPLNGCVCNDGPAWSPDGTVIAYSTMTEGANWEVVTAPPGGTARRVTDNATYDVAPDWSPDGSRLVYASGEEIVVSTKDGMDRRVIARGSDPDWSPAGDRIAFVKDGEIWVVNPDASGERRVTEGGGLYTPSWSPDGTRLAVTRCADPNPCEIATVDPNGGVPTRVVAGFQPSWSPDGGRIAFVVADADEYDLDLHVIRADGTDERTLTDNGSDDYSPAWSPDGARIAFVRARGESEIYAMSAEGGAETRLTSAQPKDVDPLVEIRTLEGQLVSRFLPTRAAQDVVLSEAAVATISYDRKSARLELFRAANGARLGAVSISRHATSLSISGTTVVFGVGRRIWALDARTRKRKLLATAAAAPIGLSIEGNRVAWAENLKTTARIRSVTVRR